MSRDRRALLLAASALLLFYIFSQVWLGKPSWQPAHQHGLSVPDIRDLQQTSFRDPVPYKTSSPRIRPPTTAPTTSTVRPKITSKGGSNVDKGDEVLEIQRSMNERELEGYQFYGHKELDDLLMDKGGTPQHTLVVTSWRSGSTFLSEIMERHPSMYYHYEPLMTFGIKRLRDGPKADRAQQVLQNLHDCNYERLGQYIKYGWRHPYVFRHNTRLWRHCEKPKPFCHQASFLSRFCQLFPFQVTKTVRLQLQLVTPLLEAPGSNLKVLLLVRDPRATLQSRKHRKWCPGNPDCADPRRLCSDLQSDYAAAQSLARTYGRDRFRVVRYEDLSLNLNASVPALLDFAQLQYHKSVKNFIATHTRLKKGDASSTYRDSRIAPFLWSRQLTWNETQDIQTACEAAMVVWGYKVITKEQWRNLTGTAVTPADKDIFVHALKFSHNLVESNDL